MKTKTLFNAKRVAMTLIAIVTIGIGQMWATKTYTYTMNYAGGKGAADANVSYWYTNSTCTTSCKIESGTNNRFTSATTIYYKDATISSTAFTVTPAGDGNYATFKLNSTACYFFLGKDGATFTLPTYSGEKITNVTITRGNGGSSSAKVNIYSGENAASTEQTFASSGSDYSFDIVTQYQATSLTIKLTGTGSYNTSFNKIVITTEPNTFTVTYDGNGNTSGTAPTDASSPYAPSSTVTVKANTGSLARTGCTFAGWNTEADGSGTSYAATGAATFTISANTTLYAKWTATVTWTVNGTTVRTDNICVPADGKTLTPPDAPSPASYCGDKFMGWTDHEIDGSSGAPTPLFNGTRTVTGDTNFYAVFADENP